MHEDGSLITCDICDTVENVHEVEYTHYEHLCNDCDTGACCIQCGEMIDPDDGQEMCFDCYSDSMPD